MFIWDFSRYNLPNPTPFPGVEWLKASYSFSCHSSGPRWDPRYLVILAFETKLIALLQHHRWVQVCGGFLVPFLGCAWVGVMWVPSFGVCLLQACPGQDIGSLMWLVNIRACGVVSGSA